MYPHYHCINKKYLNDPFKLQIVNEASPLCSQFAQQEKKKKKTGFFFALIVLLQLLKLANKNCDHLHISTSTWYIKVIDLDNACI